MYFFTWYTICQLNELQYIFKKNAWCLYQQWKHSRRKTGNSQQYVKDGNLQQLAIWSIMRLTCINKDWINEFTNQIAFLDCQTAEAVFMHVFTSTEYVLAEF